MNDIFAAVDARPKRRPGIGGQTIEAQMRGTMCQITEYELDVLRGEIFRLSALLEYGLKECARETVRAAKAEAEIACLTTELQAEREHADRLARQLDVDRHLVSDGAATGFVWSDGNWAERLFENNAEISSCIRTHTERRKK